VKRLENAIKKQNSKILELFRFTDFTKVYINKNRKEKGLKVILQ
jgi:hypothetical protein